MQDFSNIKALIIDMDGVLWHGDKAIAGLIEFFQLLRDKQIRFILATNNASLTREQYVTKLEKMGVTVALDQILTSGIATALYLAEHYEPTKTRVYVLGEDGASQPLAERGFILTDLYDVTADVVVVGKDSTLTWDKIATATLNVRNGAKFIGTNADTTLPTEHGITHGNGAILAAIQTASGVAPVCIGKPEPIIYQQAIALLGASLDETVAIGDRLETDILGAVNTGIRSLMVLTGISSEADLVDSDYQPTWVLPDLQALTAAIKELSI
ncbi:MAG: HAD-IIA family hydrolase [Methylococcaceae bacterium]|nr:HAD-IIA family hydrolase [Methylococcaceae bacterium]MDD1616769.1 HAD-IIA family hydrolase [Methylococcaceae bacterium]OYV16898.1 MAG: 4-nitrophenyl phosphatase [Methylococcaceae bacterium NSP1-2]